MNKAARYVIENGFMIENQNGAFMLADDYDALQQKLDALAAENAALKSAISRYAKVKQDFDDFDGDRRGIAESLCEAEDTLVGGIKTPATDAYLNSVRAEGAGAVAEYHKERFEFIKNTRHDIANEHKAAYLCALDVAAQLRAGEVK